MRHANLGAHQSSDGSFRPRRQRASAPVGLMHHGVAADCWRMLWDGRRWLIGPGVVPFQPGSQPWPGTDAVYGAGYRGLVTVADLACAKGMGKASQRLGRTAGQVVP